LWRNQTAPAPQAAPQAEAEVNQSPSELLMTHPKGGGLETITDVQRAFCRIADGYPLPPELARDRRVLDMCGGTLPPVREPPVPPGLLMLVCAIRSGKTQLAGGFGLRMALTVDLSSTDPRNPMPRVAIVSADKDNATAAYQWITNTVTESDVLKPRVQRDTTDTLVIRRDDGREVEIKVVAAARQGTTLVSRWLAGVIFDECTLMVGGDDSVVRLEDSIRQCKGRLLPGAQIIMIGSSHAPPRGHAYDLLHELWGHPEPDRVALWTTGPDMAPFRYTPEFCASLDEDIRRVSTTRTFLDPESAFLTAELVDRARRDVPEVLAPRPGRVYVAGSDPAARHNAWTLVIVGIDDGVEPNRYEVVLAREWVPTSSERLSTPTVLHEIAELVEPYGIDTVHADAYMGDALADMAADFGLCWLAETPAEPEARDGYFRIAHLLQERLLDLPPSAHLRDDLLSVTKRVTPNGVKFHLPQTPGGRHCDYAPALLQAVTHLPESAALPAPQPRKGSAESYWAKVKRELRRNEADPMGSRMRRLLG